MDVYVFDKSINPLGIIDAYTSLQWIRRYFKAGEFEFICSVTDKNVALLQKGNILWPQGDKEAGYINYKNFKLDDTGQEIIDVKGRLLTGYLGQRIIWDLMYLDGTAENIMRTLVNKSAISPTTVARIIPILSLGTAQGYTQTSTYQTPNNSRDNLEDELEALSIAAKLGHRILFNPDEKQLVFEVYAGLDRTMSQEVNSPAIFSKEKENVLTQEYTDSNDNLKTVVLSNGIFTVGSGDTATSIPVSVIVGDASGLDRYEEYIDGSTQSDSFQDSSGNTSAITQANYETVLTNNGVADLAAHSEVRTFDSTIDIKSNPTYKKDFDLGDICPCLNRAWGVEVNAQITEITEVYEESGVTITPTFGNNVPTLIDKIKQKMR